MSSSSRWSCASSHLGMYSIFCASILLPSSGRLSSFVNSLWFRCPSPRPEPASFLAQVCGVVELVSSVSMLILLLLMSIPETTFWRWRKRQTRLISWPHFNVLIFADASPYAVRLYTRILVHTSVIFILQLLSRQVRSSGRRAPFHTPPHYVYAISFTHGCRAQKAMAERHAHTGTGAACFT